MARDTPSIDDACAYEVSWNSLPSLRSCGQDKWKVNGWTDIQCHTI